MKNIIELFIYMMIGFCAIYCSVAMVLNAVALFLPANSDVMCLIVAMDAEGYPTPGEGDLRVFESKIAIEIMRSGTVDYWE